MPRFLLVVVLSTLQLGCAQAQDSGHSGALSGQLLFVEDVDGKDGLTAGSFGDIIVIDSTGRHRLTRDAFYDAHPSWSPDAEQILFESKRDPEASWAAGLTEPSGLYVLDIDVRRVTRFDTVLQQRYPNHVGRENTSPTWSPQGDAVVFFTVTDGDRHALVARLDSSSVHQLDLNGIDAFGIERFTWSPSGDALLFDYRPHQAVIRAVAVYMLADDSLHIITDNVQKGPLWGKGATTCEAGSSLSTSAIFIFACSPLGGEQTTVYRYHLRNGTTDVIAEIRQHYAKLPQVSERQQKMVYIAGDNKNAWNDIWMYDLASGQHIQLTNDHHAKDYLNWRE